MPPSGGFVAENKKTSVGALPMKVCILSTKLHPLNSTHSGNLRWVEKENTINFAYFFPGESRVFLTLFCVIFKPWIFSHQVPTSKKVGFHRGRKKHNNPKRKPFRVLNLTTFVLLELAFAYFLQWLRTGFLGWRLNWWVFLRVCGMTVSHFSYEQRQMMFFSKEHLFKWQSFLVFHLGVSFNND